ncbi:hypothetical protein CGLO_14167 [Colletotrichum gloeosporioides Cg-14]|nr:hypothetical protein CGLO_14167 [Colletotrichum gloeosporioides Cg-14]
MLKSRAI